jgi:hypothetical protein
MDRASFVVTEDIGFRINFLLIESPYSCSYKASITPFQPYHISRSYKCAASMTQARPSASVQFGGRLLKTIRQ